MTGRQVAQARRSAAFDAWDLAARRAALEGAVSADGLPKVVDRLAGDGPGAQVRWRIEGAADAVGRPALAVTLEGKVPLECQRCLRTFEWPVRQQTLLLLARDERELARLDEDDLHEVVLAAEALDPLPLVEDELLLTLPFAPQCGRGDCVVGAGATAGAKAGSPFAALGALKGEPRRKE
jgi:uncharacterized protein